MTDDNRKPPLRAGFLNNVQALPAELDLICAAAPRDQGR
jgi:hypothetical protein